MITTDNLPANYKPYQNLIFCGNNITGGGHIFAMGKVLPLLVGMGTLPRIWLQAISAPGSKVFISIVDDSKSTHPAVDVITDGSKVVVSVRGKTVLAAESIDEQRAIVSELDFRPLGLNLFGNSSSLNLGGMQMSQNTFSGVGVAFGLGA